MGPPNPRNEIASGVFAGVCEACASHPIDMMKTQYHISTGPNPSVYAGLKAQVRSEGFLSIYRGLLAACLRPQALCMYAGNEWCKRLLVGDGDLTTATAPVAGFLSGYIEAACVTPFELVKVRLQSVEHRGRYKNSLQCATAIVRDQGPGGLYAGLGPTTARNCIYNGAYFGFVFAIKDSLPPPDSTLGAVGLNLGTGMVSGCLATVIKSPVDVVKSRMQNQLPGDTTYISTLQAVRRIAAEEGIGALFNGLGANMLRISVGMSVSLAAFEFALAELTAYTQDPAALPDGTKKRW